DTKHERQITFLDGLRASSPVFSGDGHWLAFEASRSRERQYPLPFNGNIIRSYQNAPEEARLGVVSTLGTSVWWVPVLGRASDVQFTGDGSLLYQEVSPDRKTREIKVAGVMGTPRTIWRDHDDRWWSPVDRDQKLVSVSPDGRS